MTTATTDAPAPLTFVDPNEDSDVYTVCLWAASGEGKTVAACSAPGPIVALSADRKGAYRFARAYYGQAKIRESRFTGSQSLADLYRYLRDHPEIKSVILDPFKTIVDTLVDEGPKQRDGQPNWQAINKKILGFLHSLREFDVNVVIVAHEKVSETDGKVYPELGGPSLINKITAEMDIVAHVERETDKEGTSRWMAQLAPTPQLVCKDSTPGGLGARREINLTEWFEAGAAPARDDSDLPWSDDAPDQIKAELDATEV